MLSFIKSLLWPSSKRDRGRLHPESQFIATISETEVSCRRPDGRIECVSLADLRSVTVETNDSGPWGIDFWWILLGDAPDSGCVIPQGATGEDDVLEVLQKLPGFDNLALLEANRSTGNNRFVCWSRAPD